MPCKFFAKCPLLAPEAARRRCVRDCAVLPHATPSTLMPDGVNEEAAAVVEEVMIEEASVAGGTSQAAEEPTASVADAAAPEGHINGAILPAMVDGWPQFPSVRERYFTTFTTSNHQCTNMEGKQIRFSNTGKQVAKPVYPVYSR